MSQSTGGRGHGRKYLGPKLTTPEVRDFKRRAGILIRSQKMQAASSGKGDKYKTPAEKASELAKYALEQEPPLSIDEIKSLPLWKRRTYANSFEQAAAAYLIQGDNDKALKFYQHASEYLPGHYKGEISRIEHKLNRTRDDGDKGLGRKVMVAAAILCFAFTLLVISFNFTGHAVLEMNHSSSNLVSLCFFICGLIFAFLYIRGKKKF